MALAEAGELERVDLIYTQFLSAGSQRVEGAASGPGSPTDRPTRSPPIRPRTRTTLATSPRRSTT